MCLIALLLLQNVAAEVLAPITNTLHVFWQGFLSRIPHIIIAAIVVFIGLRLTQPVSRAVSRVGERGSHHNLAELLSRLVRIGFTILSLLVAAVIVFPTFEPGDLIAGLGITSVAIGFALKDILQNFFAGILILWREPFKVGDEIRSGVFEGVVESISTRSTRIRTYDGERALLPNGDVFTQPILVKTAYDRRRVKIKVVIVGAEAAESRRDSIESAAGGVEGVLKDPPPLVSVAELAPASVTFGVYVWVKPAQTNVLAVTDRIVTAIQSAVPAAIVSVERQ